MQKKITQEMQRLSNRFKWVDITHLSKEFHINDEILNKLKDENLIVAFRKNNEKIIRNVIQVDPLTTLVFYLSGYEVKFNFWVILSSRLKRIISFLKF